MILEQYSYIVLSHIFDKKDQPFFLKKTDTFSFTPTSLNLFYFYLQEVDSGFYPFGSFREPDPVQAFVLTGYFPKENVPAYLSEKYMSCISNLFSLNLQGYKEILFSNIKFSFASDTEEWNRYLLFGDFKTYPKETDQYFLFEDFIPYSEASI